MGIQEVNSASELRRYKHLGWRDGNLVFPNDEGPWDPSWLEPLNLVTKAVAGNPRFRFFDPADFMTMNMVLRAVSSTNAEVSTSTTPGSWIRDAATGPGERAEELGVSAHLTADEEILSHPLFRLRAWSMLGSTARWRR